jgi:hypothetical protein
VYLGIAGSFLAACLAGCGEPTQDEGPTTYKGTNSPAIEQLRDNMSANAKNKSAASRGSEDKSAAKDAEKKPAAESGADTKK